MDNTTQSASSVPSALSFPAFLAFCLWLPACGLCLLPSWYPPFFSYGVYLGFPLILLLPLLALLLPSLPEDGLSPLPTALFWLVLHAGVTLAGIWLLGTLVTEIQALSQGGLAQATGLLGFLGIQNPAHLGPLVEACSFGLALAFALLAGGTACRFRRGNPWVFPLLIWDTAAIASLAVHQHMLRLPTVEEYLLFLKYPLLFALTALALLSFFFLLILLWAIVNKKRRVR